MDSFEKLKQTKALLDQGVISEEEYQRLKEKLMLEIEQGHKAAPKEQPVNNAQPAESQGTVNTAPPQGSYTVQPAVISQEGASTGMKVLSFLIPLVGLILFLVNQNTKPVEAKDELKWAAIGFGIGVLCYVLMVGCAASSYY